MKKLLLGLMTLFLTASMIITSVAVSATIEVNEFLPYSNAPSAGSWYQSDVRTGGSASVVNFAGGAAMLTTDMTDAAKAEVGIFGDFGLASAVLSDILLGYDYYKQSVSGGNIFAAPSLKLMIYAAGGTGDNYGQLIYEPSWNIGAGSIAVPTDTWKNVSINSSTGNDLDGYGGWWWSGGFEISNSFGGPPILSLSQWATAFQAADPTDFPTARVVGVSMGVGSYNQGQIGYFDNVSIKSVAGNIDAVYDFKTPSAPIPEPATMLLFGLGLLGMAGVSRRKN